MSKFFEHQIVITPRYLPAFILSVSPCGKVYSVNEMFKKVPQFYNEDELRLATEEECEILGESQVYHNVIGNA